MGRPKKQRDPQVLVSLDFGGSGLKGIFQKASGEFQVLYMEPLASFETPTGMMAVKLSNFLCYPEGAGV
ncbi:MAG: hypothetical protein ACRDEA_10770 [Microcystaceae cyanobacterium]